MNIFLIRHSEQLRLKGEKNVKDNTQTQNEKIVLSVEGEKKAFEISNLQELKNIDYIWCSNYVRAIATAKYISELNALELNIDQRLNERKLRKFRYFEKIR